MAGVQNQTPNTDLFDAYFRRADLDGDGQISGAEAVAFFQASNLPKQVLAQVWMHADQKKAGYLGRAEFYNALKLVTVAQSKRELTPDIVKAALYGPASAKIPAPQINLAATAAPQSKVAAPVPQLGGTTSASSQNIGISRPPLPGNAITSQQYFPSQQNQFMRPPQAVPPGTASHPQQVLASEVVPRGGNAVASRPPNLASSTDWLSTGGSLAGVTPQVPSRGIGPSTTQDGFGLTSSSVQSRPQETTGPTHSTAPKPQDPSMPPNQLSVTDSAALVVSGNGSTSDSVFGDLFSATPSQPKQISLAATSSVGSLPALTAIVPASAGPQPLVKPTPLEPLQSSFPQQSVGGQYQHIQLTGKRNQHAAGQSTTSSTSTGFPVGIGNSASTQSTQSQLPWPRMTHSDVQKYTKVFVQVDTDRDGKITGEQARNLFLSWRLPREVLKQVWDLSDQDNDSMLSVREFCTALYLMERYREGRPLPTVLPSTIMPDETLLSTRGQPSASHGNASWGPSSGLQQPQVMTAPRPISPAAGGRPPRPFSVSQADGTVQPSPQKPRVPVLEKHLVNQLSNEEQDSLNSKFQEATEADKKVEELEKEISTSREKIEFYRVKMQELILYKSRCDGRLNEITERVSADKREAESLAKKYEEKYKQVGDVASKLTIEEATFRDIQERKMEFYQAIVKMEGDNADGVLQDRANRIHLGLEELVKTVNDRCKQYGLHAKPTSLVELPFGWQPGIQGGAADWDEDWDKFEDEGFTFVKELTLDVQNVIAPPKPKSSSVQKETISTNEGVNDLSTNADVKSEKVPNIGERIPENELAHDRRKDALARSPPDSPAERSAVEGRSEEFQDFHFQKSIGADGSPHAKDTQSDHGGAESVLSGDKSFDEPSWGTFDTQYDTESVWGFDPVTKDMDHERHGESSIFGPGDFGRDFGLKPIRTESPHADNMFQGKSSSIFADSVPSTPAYNFGNSPRRFSEGSEEHSFDSFSRFDSFSMHDSGFFQSPRHSLARFDSVRSSRDSDQGLGFPSRFDSFNAHESGFFQSPQNSLARFDSIRSTKDSDQNHGFPSFDETDPFGSTGPFRTSVENQTPRRGSDNWSAF